MDKSDDHNPSKSVHRQNYSCRLSERFTHFRRDFPLALGLVGVRVRIVEWLLVSAISFSHTFGIAHPHHNTNHGYLSLLQKKKKQSNQLSRMSTTTRNVSSLSPQITTKAAKPHLCHIAHITPSTLNRALKIFESESLLDIF